MSCSSCDSPLVGCVAIIPAEICIRFVRGTDSTFECILLDGRGEPVNITDDEVRLTAKDRAGGTIKIQKCNCPGMHSDAPNGRTSYTFVPEDITESQGTDRLEWVYEVRRIRSFGDEAVHITGPFIVDPQVGD